VNRVGRQDSVMRPARMIRLSPRRSPHAERREFTIASPCAGFLIDDEEWFSLCGRRLSRGTRLSRLWAR